MRQFKLHVMHALTTALVLGTQVASGSHSIPPSYRFTAAQFDIPSTVLYAVALTESGLSVRRSSVSRPWPWTLNVAGTGYYFNSRQAAWRALKHSLNSGERSIDVGLMQINWRYHHERLGSPWQALDPYHGLAVGTAILKRCHQGGGDWMKSVGCYHAPNHAQRAARYRRRVASQIQQLQKKG